MSDIHTFIESTLNKWNNDSSCLISILLDIQDEYNYLPQEALCMVAEDLGIPLINIYSAATFYKVFSLQPRGKYLINVCVGTACHVRGGQRVVEEIERILDVCVGETTPDMQFTLETVRCLGACALGPVVVVNEEYHGHMDAKKVGKLIKHYQQT